LSASGGILSREFHRDLWVIAFQLIKIISDIKEKVFGCVDGCTGGGHWALYSHISELPLHMLELKCI